jgi:hypothetical protein
MIITAVLGGVMTFHNPRDAGASSSSNRPQNPLITHVVGRDLSILVVSSPRGPLYSATDRSGKPLAQNLTLDELRAAHPSLHQQIEPAVAGTSDHAWAGIDRD